VGHRPFCEPAVELLLRGKYPNLIGLTGS